MSSRPQVLVVSSDSESRQTLLQILVQYALEPVCSSTVKEARAVLARQPVLLAICEADLTDGTFRDLLRAVQDSKARIPVVVASRLDDTDAYLEAMGSGAFDFIARPYLRSEVERIVGRALPRAFAAAV